MEQRSLLLFTLLCLITRPIWAKSIEMDKTAFDSLTASGIWFVEHFSPYCHFCIDFAPTWKELTEEEDNLARTHDIHFGTIDCSIHGDLCIEHDITGFPKMKLYVNGKYEQTYIDARSKETIKAYLLQEHRRLKKVMSVHHKGKPTTTTTTPTPLGSGVIDATMAGSIHGDRQWKDVAEPAVTRFDITSAQDLLDDQRMMILGAYGSDDELFRHQFRRLSKKENGAVLFAELDLDTNGDVAQNIFDIQKAKVLIVDGKKKLYYDRDIHSELLNIQQPRHILHTLDDVIAGKLNGNPIRSLEQHEHFGYSPLDWHGCLTLVVFAFLVAVVYKTISRQKLTTTNWTHPYVNSLSKLV